MQDDTVSDELGSSRKWRADDPRRVRMAAKRASILASARPILLRDGLGGATLDRVAAEGGVAKMTLYRHFPSKEALFAGLVDAMCEEMRQGIESAPSSGNDLPCRQKLSNELHAFRYALIQPDALALYRLVVAEGWRTSWCRSGVRRVRYARDPGCGSLPLSKPAELFPTGHGSSPEK